MNSLEKLEDFLVAVNELTYFLEIIWAGMSLCALLVAFVPDLSIISKHGKCTPDGTNKLLDIRVPKSWFKYFYLCGILVSVVYASIVSMMWESVTAVHLTLVLYTFQCARRLVECLFITEYGNSTMHIGGFLGGMAHYAVAAVTLGLAGSIEPLHMQYSKHTITIITIVFTSLSIFQYLCHRILFLKKQKILKDALVSPSDRIAAYSLPSGLGFEYCCCPHYFAEIGIYLCLALLNCHSRAALLLFLWVLTNLSVVAYEQFLWYAEHHTAELERRNLAVLIPFLW